MASQKTVNSSHMQCQSLSDALLYMHYVFPQMSEAEVKDVYLLDHKYDTLQSQELEDIVTSMERNVWKAFWLVEHSFLDSSRNETYIEHVAIINE